MPGRIDWQAARERLAMRAKVAQVGLNDEQRDAIFARRAEELAVPAADAERGDGFEALVFGLGAEWYAVVSSQVREVRSLDQLTTLPGAPPFVAGLVNVRGRVVPVLDLRPIFGLAVDGPAASTALLLASSRGDVGVLATSRPAVRWLLWAQLGSLPDGAPPGLDPAFVRGVTPDLVVVLDAERLLADRRLLVEHES